MEAIIILIQRLRGQSDSLDYNKQERTCGMSIRKWFLVADISFLIGTVGDTVTSYIYIFWHDNYKLGYSAIVFATCWLICAFVYLTISIYDHIQYKKYFLELLKDDDIENENKGGGNGNNNKIPIGSIGFPNTTDTTTNNGNGNNNGNDIGAFDDETNSNNQKTNKNRSTLDTEERSDSIDDISSPPESSNNSNSDNGGGVGGEPLLDEREGVGAGVGNEEKKDDGGGNTGVNVGGDINNNSSPTPINERSDIVNYLFPKGHPTSTVKKTMGMDKDCSSVVDDVVTCTIPENINIATSNSNTFGLGMLCGALSLNNDDNNDDNAAAAAAAPPSVNIPATYTTNMATEQK